MYLKNLHIGIMYLQKVYMYRYNVPTESFFRYCVLRVYIGIMYLQKLHVGIMYLERVYLGMVCFNKVYTLSIIYLQNCKWVLCRYTASTLQGALCKRQRDVILSFSAFDVAFNPKRRFDIFCKQMKAYFYNEHSDDLLTIVFLFGLEFVRMTTQNNFLSYHGNWVGQYRQGQIESTYLSCKSSS